MITPNGIRNISDARDFTDTTGAGADGFSMVWDNATGKFILSEVTGVSDHGALTGLADDDHTQYLLATGSRTGATSVRQVFTSGITTGTIRPASDSTTALQLQNAAGTEVLTIDTTNRAIVSNRGTGATNFLLGTAGNITMTAFNATGMGIGAAAAITSSSNWMAIGGDAAKSVTTGNTFLAFGFQSGYSNVSGNNWAAIGFRAGYTNVSGSDWTAIGREAGYTATGSSWLAVGYNAARNNTTGTQWLAIGYRTAYNATGFNFSAIGYEAGYSNTRSNWSAIGFQAGRNAVSQASVFIGYLSGLNETTDNRLHIANDSTKSLLLGDFANNRLMIGDTALTVPTATLDVAASTTAQASLRIRSGTAPTSPNDGDIWFDGTDLKIRVSGATYTLTKA